MLPKIIITSYLGDKGSAMRKLRLGFHMKQREGLRKLFPDLSIVSVCSAYTPAERKSILSVTTQKEVDFVPDRLMKWQSHNRIFERLYKTKKLTNVLLLDDDILPWDKEDQGLIDPVDYVRSVLENPKLMPCPAMFFSCFGLKYDSFYRNRDKAIIPAPISVVGWAILVRSDLGVFQATDTTASDDFLFRVRCHYFKKGVAKHNQVFFRTFQRPNRDDSESTVVVDHGERVQEIKESRAYACKKYPHTFKVVNGGKLRFVTRPKFDYRERAGFLSLLEK